MSAKGVDLSGKTFGSLTVVRLFGNINKRRRWWCQCSCGKELDILQHSLTRGATVSCGCRKKSLGSKNPNWNGYKEITGSQWANIRNNAKTRKILFEITIEYAWDIFEKQKRQCALSGLPLIFSTSYNRELKWSDREDTNASLDRIDSSSGYVAGNIQWLDKDVNLMKRTLETERFIALCKMVSQRF